MHHGTIYTSVCMHTHVYVCIIKEKPRSSGQVQSHKSKLFKRAFQSTVYQARLSHDGHTLSDQKRPSQPQGVLSTMETAPGGGHTPQLALVPQGICHGWVLHSNAHFPCWPHTLIQAGENPSAPYNVPCNCLPCSNPQSHLNSLLPL